MQHTCIGTQNSNRMLYTPEISRFPLCTAIVLKVTEMRQMHAAQLNERSISYRASYIKRRNVFRMDRELILPGGVVLDVP